LENGKNKSQLKPRKLILLQLCTWYHGWRSLGGVPEWGRQTSAVLHYLSYVVVPGSEMARKLGKLCRDFILFNLQKGLPLIASSPGQNPSTTSPYQMKFGERKLPFSQPPKPLHLTAKNHELLQDLIEEHLRHDLDSKCGIGFNSPRDSFRLG
jgi:hypothetical protein